MGICKYTNAAGDKGRDIESPTRRAVRRKISVVRAVVPSGQTSMPSKREVVPESRGFPRREVTAVVTELRAVMAVYEGTCVAG